MQTDPKTLEERYTALPNDVREAIASVDVANHLREISKKYELTIDKLDDLFDEAGLVMLGVTHPSKFVANLKARLDVSMDTAVNIAKDVNEKIFKPIRSSLQLIHNMSTQKADNESIIKDATDNAIKDVSKNIDKDSPLANQFKSTQQNEPTIQTVQKENDLPRVTPVPTIALTTEGLPKTDIKTTDKIDQYLMQDDEIKANSTHESQNEQESSVKSSDTAEINSTDEPVDIVIEKDDGLPEIHDEKLTDRVASAKDDIIKEDINIDTPQQSQQPYIDPYREPI